MVRKGEATLDCDKGCDAFKASKENVASKEKETRKQEELKAQQVSDMLKKTTKLVLKYELLFCCIDFNP